MVSLCLLLDGCTLSLAPATIRKYCFVSTVSVIGFVTLRGFMSRIVFGGGSPDMYVSVENGSFRKHSVPWTAAGMRGWREAMEDAHIATMLDPSVFPDCALFAVLDGHGGAEVSRLAADLLVREVTRCGREQLAQGKETLSLEDALSTALPRLDARLSSGFCGLGKLFRGAFHPFVSTGSTACVVVVDFVNRDVVVANVGDSRAMLVRNGKALHLSDDHKPENPLERQRILGAGGRVVKVGPCHRVDGNLNLSRALGDFHLKANRELPPESQKVIAVPDVKRQCFTGGPQELLVVACDGLFERFSNQELTDHFWPLLRKGLPLQQIAEEILHRCCARGINGVAAEAGTDNETLILVKLPLAETEKTAGGLTPGQHVEVHSLTSPVGKTLNNLIAVVEGPSDSADRCDVRFLTTGAVKKIKAENLRAQDSDPSK